MSRPELPSLHTAGSRLEGTLHNCTKLASLRMPSFLDAELVVAGDVKRSAGGGSITTS